MIYGLFCQFHSHFLVNDNLSANLCNGFLDSAAFLDTQYHSFLQLSFLIIRLLPDKYLSYYYNNV